MRELKHVVRSAGGHEGVVDLRLGDHAAQRLHAVGDLLGEGHDVGHHAEGVGAGHGAAAAEAGDDLVEDQQDVVLGADFAQALQVAHGRDHHAGRAAEGLDDDGGDVAGVVQRDQVEQAVGQGLTALGRLALGEGAGGRLGVGQVVGLDALAVDLAVGDHAADRDAAEVDAVVALLAANQARLAALALQAPVSARHLQRRVGGLGAAGGEEHVIEPRGRQAFQLVGQLERKWVAELERGRIVELRGLLAHGLGDLAPAMAEARAPQAREAVEHLAAIGGGEVGALRGHDHARVALELAVGGEGHPVRVEPGGVVAGGTDDGLWGGGEGHGVSFRR